MVSLDDIAETLFDQETIHRRVAELARDIVEEYKGKRLIILTVMKGADDFSVDLRRAMHDYSVSTYNDTTVNVIPDIMMLSLFGDGSEPKTEADLILGPNPKLGYQNTDVLIVEDIVERGYTMQSILGKVRVLEPASIAICTLLDKPHKHQVEGLPIKYVGFEVGDEFVVGYGLDFRDEYRTLPFIGVLKPEVYAA